MAVGRGVGDGFGASVAVGRQVGDGGGVYVGLGVSVDCAGYGVRVGGSDRQSSYQWPPEVGKGEGVGLPLRVLVAGGTDVSVGATVGVGRGESVVGVGSGEIRPMVERAATPATRSSIVMTASIAEALRMSTPQNIEFA